MNWKRVSLTWLMIVAAESVSGTLRRLFIAPLMGDMPSRQLGVFLGSAIIFLITVMTFRGMALRSSKEQLLAGAFWTVLTIGFEVGLGLLARATQERILSDYDLRQGGLMIFGLLFMLFSPFLAAKLPGVIDAQNHKR
ncbi:MAG: hypothetical protein HGB20_00835 [Chlorobiaceae bacterium]|nr:hypothetical protein [Chlorobiaceae bacterium]